MPESPEFVVEQVPTIRVGAATKTAPRETARV